MKYTQTIKNLTLTEDMEKVLTKHIAVLKRKLVGFADDLPELSLMIKHHDKNNFYSCLLTLSLPKKPLIVHSNGHALEEIIRNGFEKLDREFNVYKNKHFKGSSKYPNHETINTLLNT